MAVAGHHVCLPARSVLRKLLYLEADGKHPEADEQEGYADLRHLHMVDQVPTICYQSFIGRQFVRVGMWAWKVVAELEGAGV